MPLLNNGDVFPTIELNVISGGSISLPGALLGTYGVVLIYRGSWCPYCNAQLVSFSRAAQRLADANIGVAAMSVDDRPAAEALVGKYDLAFPVAWGVDAVKIAAATGAYVNDEPRHLQSTGFVLDPEGRVLTAVYSSAAIGRLVADDVIGFVRYLQSR